MKHGIIFILSLIAIPFSIYSQAISPLLIYNYLMEEFSNNLMDTGNFEYEKYKVEVYFCRFFRPITKNCFPSVTENSVTIKDIIISFCCHMKITFANLKTSIILKDVFTEFKVKEMTLKQNPDDLKYYLKELEISDLFISKKSEIMQIKTLNEFQQDTNKKYYNFVKTLTAGNVKVILKNKDG